MGPKVYINGELIDKENARISVFDHGFLYGDGVFEGIRAYNGKVFKMKEHVDRLFDSAAAIELKVPVSKDQYAAAIESTLKANKLRDAYIRAIVTRGIGTLGLNPRSCTGASVVIITDSMTLYPKELYENGLSVITVSTIRNHPNALDPRIKSLNYLNNILAKIEGLNAGVEESVMLNIQGYVAECTGDNIFIVKRGVLITPPLSAGILDGITRHTVMDLAGARGIAVRDDNITRYDLFTAEECFLTGTAAELIPVVKIDGRLVADGKPGPVTLQLLGDFRKLTRG
ncbi:MAG TPA: branched-chain-amino-acid transaminase [Phycisphaerae bacterium]|nr:branched-chain-amino-acid transaminase [Phycisphaerae bacterium]